MRKGDTFSFAEKNQIRGKLRFLARLLHMVQKLTQSKQSFSELLNPTRYTAFVESVTEIRKSNKQLAIQLGTMLKKMCLLNIGESIKQGNQDMRKAGEDFLTLYNGSWSEEVVASTLRMQKLHKLNKTLELPLTADIVRFTEFLRQEIEHEMINSSSYSRLSKLVLASLLVYNKRRPAEIADIKVSDYQLAVSSEEQCPEEVMSSLTIEERVLANRYDLCIMSCITYIRHSVK